MTPEITALIASVKATIVIAKGIGSLKSDIDKKEAISSVLETLLSVQQDALSMQEQYYHLMKEKDALAKKLEELEKWSEIESKYELKEIAPGVFVYSFKKIEGSTIPDHWLCTNCYKDCKISILQFKGNYSDGKKYLCPNCKTIISDGVYSGGDFSCGAIISSHSGWD